MMARPRLSPATHQRGKQQAEVMSGLWPRAKAQNRRTRFSEMHRRVLQLTALHTRSRRDSYHAVLGHDDLSRCVSDRRRWRRSGGGVDVHLHADAKLGKTMRCRSDVGYHVQAPPLVPSTESLF